MKLEIKNLFVHAEDKKILNDFNLVIDKGEVHAIMGPNGTGKSTLSKVIIGNDHYVIDKGDILVDGKTAGDIGELVLKDREMLSDNGVVIVCITLDKQTKEVLAGPEVLTRGFVYVKDNLDLIKEAEKMALDIIKENVKPGFVDFNKIKNGIRDKLGKYFYQETECKPMILVVLLEA